MAKSKGKKSNNNSKAKAKTPVAKKKPTPAKFLTCGETGERIFVATATLKDIQHPPTSSKRKILYKVPSTKTRTDLYDELALCLEDCESKRLPKYGGRPWQVICRVSDSQKSSPFFRFLRGKLELAVLPHLLEKIPEPPKFPGYTQTDQGVVRNACKPKPGLEDEDSEKEEPEEQYDLTQEEVQRMETLLSREISSLSQVAWDHRNDAKLGAPLPTISLKWTCPLRQIFNSRKAAWDHALELANAEQFVDRFLKGTGKSGALLKPFRPTKAQALQAGKVRFLRDGLWTVGQEQGWQNKRYLTLERQEQAKEQKKQTAAALQPKEGNNTDKQMFDAAEPPLKKRAKITGNNLFLATHRVAYREKRIKELKKQPAPAVDNDAPPVATKSKTAAKVGMPSPPRAQAKGKKGSFSLQDADRELRQIWRTELSAEERTSWETKAKTSFQLNLDIDDQRRWDLAKLEEEAEEIEEEESESEKESESESDGDECKREYFSEDDEEKKKGSKRKKADIDDQKAAIKLASPEERNTWEVFSEAEQEYWKRGAKKAAKHFGETKKPAAKMQSAKADEQQPTFPEFDAYQRRVFKALFEMTPEEFEENGLKGLKVMERRRTKLEHEKQKELLAQGMTHLLPQAHAMLEEKIEGWFTTSLKKRKANSRKKAAKPGEKEPELKTILPTTDAKGVATQHQRQSSSTPISPSPPLDPMLHKDQHPNLPSDQDASESGGSMEESVKDQDDEEAKQKVSSEEEEPEEEEEEEEEEVPRFVPSKHFCLTDDQIKLCYDASMEHFDAVMRTVKAKDLTRELVDGFDLLRERGRGRYDMELPAFETNKFDFLNDIKKAPWMPIVHQVLGDDVVLIHKGCFLSLPDATDQNYHQDGLHLHTTSQKPCHAVNVFTPLVDMTLQHGPTEFCVGSHILGQEDWDRRYMDTPLQKKGVPVMFDYRLGHRGLANKSKDPRPIVYCTYARAADGKVFQDSVNFSRRRYHKLGDLVDKPMSREERNKKRREQLDEEYWEDFPEAFAAEQRKKAEQAAQTISASNNFDPADFDYSEEAKQAMSLQQRKILELLEGGFKGSVKDVLRTVRKK